MTIQLSKLFNYKKYYRRSRIRMIDYKKVINTNNEKG